MLMILVEAYEEQHYKIEAPDPVKAIKFRMEQEGLKQKSLKPQISIHYAMISKMKRVEYGRD